jgi:uncharacterized membrane protein
MWVFWLLFLGGRAFVVGVVLTRGRRISASKESPEEILKRGYAHGEMEQAEYQKRLQDLRP